MNKIENVHYGVKRINYDSIRAITSSIMVNSSEKINVNYKWQHFSSGKAKQEYLNGLLDLNGYQNRLRSLCYQYIHVLDTTDKNDLGYKPKNS